MIQIKCQTLFLNFKFFSEKYIQNRILIMPPAEHLAGTLGASIFISDFLIRLFHLWI